VIRGSQNRTERDLIRGTHGDGDGDSVSGGCQFVIAGIGNRFCEEEALTWTNLDGLYGLKMVLVGCTLI
jgi:hypothetical protein